MQLHWVCIQVSLNMGWLFRLLPFAIVLFVIFWFTYATCVFVYGSKHWLWAYFCFFYFYFAYTCLYNKLPAGGLGKWWCLLFFAFTVCSMSCQKCFYCCSSTFCFSIVCRDKLFFFTYLRDKLFFYWKSKCKLFFSSDFADNFLTNYFFEK